MEFPAWLRVILFVWTLFYVFQKTHESVSTEVSPAPGTSTAVLPNITSNSSESDISQNYSTPVDITTLNPPTTTADYSYLDRCPDGVPCANLGAECISCRLNYYCEYGTIGEAVCDVKPNVTCFGSRKFNRPYECRYAYQLQTDQIYCSLRTDCQMKQAPPDTYFAPCKVKDDVICLGNRTFYKKYQCNWTSGYKWSTALALSITLGGFGVDRFYLGLWREALGKLFSFGGLGVWTIVDVILIAVGYVGPHDSSLYIYPWD